MTWWICSLKSFQLFVFCMYNFLECIHTNQNNIVDLYFIFGYHLSAYVLLVFNIIALCLQSERFSYICFVFVYVSKNLYHFNWLDVSNENFRYFDSLVEHFAHMLWIKCQRPRYMGYWQWAFKWGSFSDIIFLTIFIIHHSPYWMCSVFSLFNAPHRSHWSKW